MRADAITRRFFRAFCLLLWAAVILAPLAAVLGLMIRPVEGLQMRHVLGLTFRTFGLSGLIGGLAVVIGYVPGRLLGGSSKCPYLLLVLILSGLVLPRYVLYYAWTLLFNPATEIGRRLAAGGSLGRFVWAGISSGTLILWYWPLAALVTAQGWRNMDRRIFDSAALEAGRWQVFRRVTFPLLKRPLLLAFGVCFVLSLSEFGTFHLAGVQTIGTELAVLYEMTGTEAYPAIIAGPVMAAALIVAVLLGARSQEWELAADSTGPVRGECGRWAVVMLLLLCGLSVGVPVALLVGNVRGAQAFEQFIKLHLDELLYSLAIAAVAALLAHLIALGAMSLRGRTGRGRFLATAVRASVFLAMLSPASLTAVAAMKMLTSCGVGRVVSQSWFVVSLGHAVRLAGVALIFQLLTASSRQRQLCEMARVDGASGFEVFRYVQWPQTWMTFVGCFLLMITFSLTELSATMVLLPAGVGNFAQRLLNQMHYARDQQVIASCVILISVFVILSGVVVLLLRVTRMRRPAVLILAAALAVGIGGCRDKPGEARKPRVLDIFGRTGRGNGEFVYPRAIDIGSDSSVVVVDKTGRIQRFNSKGEFISGFRMPSIEAGKPTGISLGPGGNLYVADTHYHRVVVFNVDGEIIKQFGEFGRGDGCFIYPTDIAFAGEGGDAKIFVSEYGGNDRISVFNADGEFLYSFGSWGSGAGEVSRPSALCVDGERRRLYVADACNHRIAVYSLEGELIEYMGTVGGRKGQLRYPYDLALMPNGNLIVCEFGNNRLQLFGVDGESLGIYGLAGRDPGQLAYPWGVAADDRGRVFVVDAGNNRIQVWRL